MKQIEIDKESDEPMIQEETLLKTEQYLCPANRNHKLQSLDKLLSHLHTCKEVKLADKPRFVYYCQYYQGHCFLTTEDREKHEKICQWRLGLKKQHDPTANKYSIIQPLGKPINNTQQQQKPVAYTDQQQRNYEYAIKKGLIKKKGNDEYIPDDGFEFNKDFKKVDELMKLQIQKNISDQNQNNIQFTFQNYFYMVQPQNKQLIDFLIKRIPYNLYFRKYKYYKEDEKNQIVQKFLMKEKKREKRRQNSKPDIKYNLINQIPNDILLNLLNFNTYEDYLDKQMEEFVNQKKIEEENLFTSTYLMTTDKKAIFTLQIGKDFKDIFGKNINLLDFKALFSDFITFKFKRDENINKQIEPYLSQTLDQNESNKNQKQNQNIFEEEIDIQQQRLIGELKAKLEIQKQKNQEDKSQLERNQRELQELIEKKKSLIQKESDVELQIKKVNAQINSYHSKIKSYKQELELKNQEKIKILYDQKEKELNEFIDALNQQVNQYESSQQEIKDEIQSLKEEKQKLKSTINRLQPFKLQLERQLEDLQKQESSVPQQMTQSEYYTGNEFVFDISDKIKCKACKIRKINVVYIPCGDAALCKICHEKFEQLLPHVCPICEQFVKRVYHFMWENEG
ncbi:unnamed protein product [Paramecium pentaurelia]|uniref:RING-type domain-containing protein n=1 Tax=Paramecium pentaurelia TaxID=43138 RepID=A0A8S1XL45_9CILI|nr:unnamed protein product [Paramecium pentaurelia]